MKKKLKYKKNKSNGKFIYKSKKQQNFTDKRSNFDGQLKFFKHINILCTIKNKKNFNKNSLKFSVPHLNYKFFHLNDKANHNKLKLQKLWNNNYRLYSSLDKIKNGFYKSSIPGRKDKNLQKINLDFGLKRKRINYSKNLFNINYKISKRIENIKSEFQDKT